MDVFDVALEELLDLAVSIEQSYESASYERTCELKQELETKRAAFKAQYKKGA